MGWWVVVPGLTLAQAGYAAVFAFATAACLVGLTRVRDIPDADIQRGLAGLLGLSSVWGTVEAARMLVTDAGVQRGLYIVGLVVGFATVFAWLYFTSAYAGRGLHRDRRLRRVAVVSYLAVVGLKLTNPIHGAYFTARQVAEPFPHLVIQQAPVHWAVIGLAYGGAGVGLYLLYDTFANSRQETERLSLLAVAAMLPIAADLVAVTVPAIPDLNFEAVGVAIFTLGVLFFVEEDFLRARVTARRALLADHPDPALVLDESRRLLDYNDEAAAVFGGFTERVDIATAAPVLAEALAVDAPRLSLEGRSFDILRREVPIGAGRAATTVVLREVTEAEHRRREIERQNERLSDIAAAVAHNLRNASNVLQGYIDVAATADPDGTGTGDGQADPLDVAGRTAERVAVVAEELRLLAELGQTVGSTSTVSLPEAAAEAWNGFDTGGARLDCPDFTVAADRRRLVYMLRAVFRFHVANGASVVRVEHVRSEPTAGAVGDTIGRSPEATDGAGIAGFAVRGDGAPVSEGDLAALLRFDAESRIDVPGLGPAFARALAEAHGWTVEAETEDGRMVFLVDAAEMAAT